MDVVAAIAQGVSAFLKENFQVETSNLSVQIDRTRKEFEGDYTLVVFPFTRFMKLSPEQCGDAIGKGLMGTLDFIKSFNVIKGFLNLSLSDGFWTNELEALNGKESQLKPLSGKDLILVEFSSPNTNKPLHLGHLRNIFLGNSVSQIKAYDGNQVVKTQIINDRGVHICKSMFAWKMHANGETPESSGLKGDKLVGKYYVLYDQHLRAQVAKLVEGGTSEEEAKKQATLTLKVQEMLRQWESGDPETVALWKKMNGWVYDGFAETYKRMGVDFDKLYYESDTYVKGKEIVLKALRDGVSGFYQKEDGSVWVNLEPQGLDHKLLIRADGTTVYITQDIGTAVQRYEDYPKLKQVIYTVGDEQDYHFKVLFMVLEMLGYSWAPACKHLSYGMVDLPSGKMKSREGTVVDADDIMQEVVDAAKAASAEKGKLEELNHDEQDVLFEILGIGALKFFLLRVDPRKRMMFNPEESVALNGDTGPFIQYTHARCQAVLRKAGQFQLERPEVLDEKERALVYLLSTFRSVSAQAAEELSPALIANYCLDLAKAYNQFYHDISILKAEGAERNFRLTLTDLCAKTIAQGMSLLGISVPDRM